MLISGYVLIVVALLAGLVIRSVLAYANQLPSLRPFLRIFGLIIILLASWLTISSSNELNRHFQMRQLPSVRGIITESHIGGERTYYPVVNYSYQIDSALFSGSEIIYTPGFGGKRKKNEVAVKDLALYPPGDSITVYYNKDNPAESYLHVGANWDSYAKLGLGFFLIVISIIFTTLPGRLKRAESK